MRRAISLICLLALVALLALAWTVRAQLPNRTAQLVREKYDGWAGVLRVWVYTGWEMNATGWLNRVSAAFERAHPGVYIQAQPVDADALCAFDRGDFNPPDMILFPAGLLQSADGLVPTGGLPALRDGLAGCADGYAAPVAMGGYAWACVRGSQPPEAAAPSVCPEEAPFALFSAAAVALCARSAQPQVTPEPPGIDLGLPASAGAEASDPFAEFVAGRADCVVVSQAQVRSLEALSQDGRGPDWVGVATGEAMLADQLLLMGIVQREGEDAAARQELCREFLLHLLDVEAQTQLADFSALSVRSDVSLYAGRNGFEALEAAASLPLIVPPVFDNSWREQAAFIAQEVFSGRVDALEGLRRLREALC